jgi:hypothetical protein
MEKLIRSALLALCVAAAFSPAGASAKRPPRAIDPSVWQTESFRHAHPDLSFRVSGQANYEDGHFARARSEFTEAARWGDKLSQAMLAEMYWQGTGVGVDRASAYAWMDLAAERGFVPFVAKREKFWAELNEQERERALTVGKKLYEDYGDDVAQPRLGLRLRHAARFMTGTRTSMPGAGKVILGTRGGALVSISNVHGFTTIRNGDTLISTNIGGVGMPIGLGGNQMSFDVYYAKEFWRVEPYQQWQAEQLDFARRGIVEVGAAKDTREGTGQL